MAKFDIDPNKEGVEKMSSKVMSCVADPIEKTKKHLRSVLISEKGGVALDRLERDYRELVSFFLLLDLS